MVGSQIFHYFWNFFTSTDVSNDDESMNLAFTNSISITNGVLIKFVDNEMKKDPVE